jgi:cytochrome oxidase Cu insertion factor (SCO1/SenC/PrrC family)
LPVLGTVPDFNLVERSGRRIARSELLGQPWIANFIFTSCAGVCPTLTASMARLHGELETAAPEVRTVSVSVDPHRDTPAVLSAYADRYHAAPDWLFLTGDRDAIHRLVSSGFRLSVAERSPEESMGSTDLVTHSDRFALVDAEARIRGYYRGAEAELIPQILADVRRLAAEN